MSYYILSSMLEVQGKITIRCLSFQLWFLAMRSVWSALPNACLFLFEFVRCGQLVAYSSNTENVEGCTYICASLILQCEDLGCSVDHAGVHGLLFARRSVSTIQEVGCFLSPVIQKPQFTSRGNHATAYEMSIGRLFKFYTALGHSIGAKPRGCY